MRTAIRTGNISASEIIDLLGGTSQVASLLNIKMPSVSDWKAANHIPNDKLIRLAPHIEAISDYKISRKYLFPENWKEIWPELVKKTGTHS